MSKFIEKFSVEKAHNIQTCFSKKLILVDKLPEKIQTVCGVDASYVDSRGIGAAVVLDYKSFAILESSVAICEVKTPYIPTLLSFREIAPAIASIRKLKIQSDVFLADAHGIAHPRRCGFASHLGLALGKPTIGAAKNRLIGTREKQGARVLLLDKGEVIGEELTIESSAKPIYVSIGHMVSLGTAVNIVKHCLKDRVPEPLRQAHNLATEARNQLMEKQSKYLNKH